MIIYIKEFTTLKKRHKFIKKCQFKRNFVGILKRFSHYNYELFDIDKVLKTILCYTFCAPFDLYLKVKSKEMK
jgi:hypothetical protein